MEAITRLIGALPADINAAIFVVLHIPPEGPSILPTLISRAGKLPALHPQDHTPIEWGKVYVAPPNHHLIIEEGIVRIVRGPRENRARPAIDPLFRSAALTYGSAVIGVVLTGSLDDGTAGLLAIKRRDGITVVQDPSGALYPSMPRSAIAHVDVDHITPLVDIPALLMQLVATPAKPTTKPVSEDMQREVKVAEMDSAELSRVDRVGTPSAFSCPDCGVCCTKCRTTDICVFAVR